MSVFTGYKRIALWVIIGFLTLLYQSTSVYAQAYTPPTQVLVTMYALLANGSNTGSLCQVSTREIRFGCTADPSRPYPFSSNPITVEIEGPSTNDIYTPTQRYLWDVVPREYNVQASSQGNKPLAGIEAQAIAARTYIYQRIRSDFWRPQINNSTRFHVFIPFSYDEMLTDTIPIGDTQSPRQKVREAVRKRYYLSTDTSLAPIEALFGADNRGETVQGKLGDGTLIPYLKNVPDPISAEYGSQDGHEMGLSSKGASRWSFGHTSSRGAVATTHPNYPRDDYKEGGLGDFWSVQWTLSEQILTHYYTGIQLRDANQPTQALLSPNRWIPLKITQGGQTIPFLCLGKPAVLEVWLQNAGTRSWNLGRQMILAQHGSTNVNASQLIPSETLSITLQPGQASQTIFVLEVLPHTADPAYDIYLDLFDLQAQTWMSHQTPTWRPYKLTLPVVDCKESYLPAIYADSPVNGSSSGAPTPLPTDTPLPIETPTSLPTASPTSTPVSTLGLVKVQLRVFQLQTLTQRRNGN